MLTTTRRAISGIPSSVVSLSKKRALGLALSPKFIQISCCSSSTPENSRKLILYSKPGCCLCDGLKEKLSAAFSLSSPTDPLHDVDLQIRDITTNPEWERAYQYEIPVLAKLQSDGTEVTLPRLSPRLGVEVIQRKIGEAFRQIGGLDGYWSVDGKGYGINNSTLGIWPRQQKVM